MTEKKSETDQEVILSGKVDRKAAHDWLYHYIQTKPRPGGLFLQQDMLEAYLAGREGR